MVSFVNGNNEIASYDATYFGSFGAEHIPEEIKKFIGNKSIISNIYRMQACDSIIWGYFCIPLIEFMVKGKKLLYYTNLFSPSEYEQNNKIILKYIQYIKG